MIDEYEKILWTEDVGEELLYDAVENLLAEVKFLQKQLDSLRYYCHHENYDIYNWEIKNIQTLEEEE